MRELATYLTIVRFEQIVVKVIEWIMVLVQILDGVVTLTISQEGAWSLLWK